MDTVRREINADVGKRLRQTRENLGRKRSEFAKALGISEEHYRKYESGATGLSAEKLFILFQEYGINLTYLVTGVPQEQEFNLEYYLETCKEEQKEIFWDKLFAYIRRKMKMR